MEDKNKIITFKDLFEHIVYDWGFDSDKINLYKDEEGNFHINKTYITPEELTYKTERYTISNPLIFKKLEKFYELLQETEIEKILYEK